MVEYYECVLDSIFQLHTCEKGSTNFAVIEDGSCFLSLILLDIPETHVALIQRDGCCFKAVFPPHPPNITSQGDEGGTTFFMNSSFNATCAIIITAAAAGGFSSCLAKMTTCIQ